MSRSTRRSAQTVSLFPFLDVLVCTMGSLIFMLILVATRIRADAVSRAVEDRLAAAGVSAETEAGEIEAPDDPPMMVEFEPEPQPPAAPVVNPHDREAEATIAALERSLARERVEVSARRQQIEALRRRIAESKSQLEKTRTRLAALKAQGEDDLSTREQLTEERARLEKELAELNRKIRLAQKKQNDTSSKYTFIPYDGSSGTTRRPILVECTEAGLRFIPEDVLLTPAEVAGFSEGFNPLLSGATALSRYWATIDGLNAKGEEASDPYVLLIVRPSGTVTYYYARKMLSKLRQQYGYELLDDERQLDLPPSDIKARHVVLTAVNEALAKRDSVMKEVAAGGGSRISDGLPGAGEFPPESNGPTSSHQAAAGSIGQASGRGGRAIRHRPGVGFEVVDEEKDQLAKDPFGRAVEAEETARGRGGKNVAAGPPSGSTQGRASPPGLLAREGGREPGGVIPSAAPGKAAGAPPKPGDGAGSWETAPNPFEEALQEQAGNGGRKIAGGTTRGTNASGGNSTGPLADGQRLGGTPSHAARGAVNAGGKANADAGELREEGLTAEGSSRSPVGKTSPSAQEAPMNADETVAGGASGSRPAPPNQAGARSGGSGPGTGSAQRSPDGKASGSRLAGGATGSGASGSTSGSEAEGGVGARFGPERSSVQTPRRPEARKWGLYSRRASIGFERSVRIQAFSDRLLVGRVLVVPVEEGISTNELADLVAKAIDEEAHSWGRPPDSFYWVPAVKFTVAPGGNQHVERLKGPLKQWGLASSVHYTFDQAPQDKPAENGDGPSR